MSKKIIYIYLFIIIVTILIGGGYYIFKYYFKSNSGLGEYKSVDKSIINNEVIKVQSSIGIQEEIN